MIDDNSLKTPVIPSTLASLHRIRQNLQAERKNTCVSVWNNDLFSKKLRFSSISPTDHDILGMIDDDSLKTPVIHSKLASFDRKPWTPPAECKKTCVSGRNNVLFSKKRRFRLISQTEHDILGMIDDNSLNTRVIPSKLASFDRFRWTLQAELYTRICVILWEIMFYSRTNVDFLAFHQRNTTFWVWLMITLWNFVLFLQK